MSKNWIMYTVAIVAIIFWISSRYIDSVFLLQITHTLTGVALGMFIEKKMSDKKQMVNNNKI